MRRSKLQKALETARTKRWNQPRNPLKIQVVSSWFALDLSLAISRRYRLRDRLSLISPAVGVARPPVLASTRWYRGLLPVADVSWTSTLDFRASILWKNT